MAITPHVLAGFVIAVNVESLRFKRRSESSWFIFLTCLISFLSHFVLDHIPHWDYSIYDNRFEAATNLSIDCGILSVITIFILMSLVYDVDDDKRVRHAIIQSREIGSYWLFISAAVFSMLPDLIILASKNTESKIVDYFFLVHHRLHSQIHLSYINGMLTQIVTTIVLIWVLKKSSEKLLMKKNEIFVSYEYEVQFNMKK